MKRCPKCRRDYYDGSLLYCLEDGAALVSGVPRCYTYARCTYCAVGYIIQLPIRRGHLMIKKFAVTVVVLLFAAVSFGQAELEKYVGRYQVTGFPIVFTVTAAGGKLAIEAAGSGKTDIELVSGEDYRMIGTAVTLTFQKDAGGRVTGMIIHQAPGLDVPAAKIDPSEAPSDKSPHKSAYLTANGIKMHYLDWGG